MTQKTKDYEMFKFTDDNRDGGVRRHHVEFLKNSIGKNNLLKYQPILVTNDYSIIDGQHRLVAAKELGIDIYYDIKEDYKPTDMIAMCSGKSWGTGDYLNFYVKHHYPEYMKLQDFIKKNGLYVRVGLEVTQGKSHKKMDKFKNGEYVFSLDHSELNFDICKETIDTINRLNGFAYYTNSNKFWMALIKLIKSPDFNKEKWMTNLKLLSDRMCCKTTTHDYLKTMVDIYNYRNKNTVKFEDLEDL